MVDSSYPTENRQRRTDVARAVSQSEAKSKSQSREFRNDRASTVTGCTINNAIQNQTHEDGKDLRKARLLPARLLSGLSTNHPEIKKAMEMEAEAEHRRGKETGRAKSI